MKEHKLDGINKENKFEKYTSIVWLLILIITTLPILFMAKCNFLSADDFIYGKDVYNIWKMEGIGGLPDMLQSAIDITVSNWKGWGGNYTSSFFSVLNISHFSNSLNFLNTYFLVFCVLFSCFFLGLKFMKTQRYSKYIGMLFGATISFMIIQWIPSSGEAFFWFNGSFYNIAGTSAGIVLLVMLTDIEHSNSYKFWKIFVAICLGIFTAGTNYTFVLPALIFTVLINIISFVKNKKEYRKKRTLWIVSIVFIIFSLISILAPGNAGRQILVGEPLSPVITIAKSIICSKDYIQTMINIPILVISIILFLFLKSNLRHSLFELTFITIMSYILFASGFAPTLRSMQSIGELRTQNVYYYMFIVLYFLNFVLWGQWIKAKSQMIVQRESITTKTKIAVMIFSIFVGFICINEHTIYRMNSFSAVYSIVKGEAETYYNEKMERQLIYEDTTQKEVYVKPFTNIPSVVYSNDITNSRDNWINKCMASYYQKEFIELE